MISEVDPTRSGGGAHVYASKTEAASSSQGGDAATKIFNGSLSILNQLAGTLEKSVPYLKALNAANEVLNTLSNFFNITPADVTPNQLNAMYNDLYKLNYLCSGKEPKISDPLEENYPQVWKDLNEINSNADVQQLYTDLNSLAEYENSIGMPFPPGQTPTSAEQQQIDALTKPIIADITAIQKAVPQEDVNEINLLRNEATANLTLLAAAASTEMKRALSLIQITSSQITNLTTQESGIETKMVS